MVIFASLGEPRYLREEIRGWMRKGCWDTRWMGSSEVAVWKNDAAASKCEPTLPESKISFVPVLA